MLPLCSLAAQCSQQHQPPPSHLGVIPLLHHIGARTQHRVDVIRKNRLTVQVDSEIPSLMNQLLVDPDVPVVVVPAPYRIIARQKSPAYRAIHHMEIRNLARSKHFHPRHSSHLSPPRQPNSHTATGSKIPSPACPVKEILCPWPTPGQPSLSSGRWLFCHFCRKKQVNAQSLLFFPRQSRQYIFEGEAGIPAPR